MKKFDEIVKWGRIKPYFDKMYRFNTIDIETIDNELFIFGFTENDKYIYYLDDFYKRFNDFLIKCVQDKMDCLTWTRYDNTHLLKLILSKVTDKDSINKILLRIGKVSPIYSYHYRNFTITLENIIRDSMLFKIEDKTGCSRNVILYNLKNLFTDGLEQVAKDYQIDYYSKIGVEYHVIDKQRFNTDTEYRRLVLLSNEYDNRVIKDIAKKFLDNFRSITGVYPKSIFSAGSIARSFIITQKDVIDVSEMNFKNKYGENKLFEELLDYSMRSYHGGKIESYVLGYIPKAKIIDITSAYPYNLARLPRMTDEVYHIKNNCKIMLKDFFYAFIHCNVIIKDREFIHPLIVRSPINNTNLSPWGYINDIVITKVEYDYLLKNGIEVEVLDFVGIKHVENDFPYKPLVELIFGKRMYYYKNIFDDNINDYVKNPNSNNALEDLFKKIINALYGITFELTDIYKEENDEIIWEGYRAGDFFHPVIAAYITAMTRTYLSETSYNIIQNGGKVFLNMTDSIIYQGECTLDVFSKKKVLGKYEPPKEIQDVIILGAGRYEYKDVFKGKYTIKNRGFSVNVRDKSFYGDLELNKEIKIAHRTFVSSFKATTNMYDFDDLGHLEDDEYNINPFNLGGKRILEDKKVNINKEYVRTLPVYLDKFLYLEEA